MIKAGRAVLPPVNQRRLHRIVANQLPWRGDPLTVPRPTLSGFFGRMRGGAKEDARADRAPGRRSGGAYRRHNISQLGFGLCARHVLVLTESCSHPERLLTLFEGSWPGEWDLPH